MIKFRPWAAGHKTLVPALVKSLADQGAEDIIVFVGGVIPAQAYEFLRKAGAVGIFGPGTPIATCARQVPNAIKAGSGPRVIGLGNPRLMRLCPGHFVSLSPTCFA